MHKHNITSIACCVLTPPRHRTHSNHNWKQTANSQSCDPPIAPTLIFTKPSYKQYTINVSLRAQKSQNNKHKTIVKWINIENLKPSNNFQQINTMLSFDHFTTSTLFKITAKQSISENLQIFNLICFNTIGNPLQIWN